VNGSEVFANNHTISLKPKQSCAAVRSSPAAIAACNSGDLGSR
jgi:hypothetical protein